MKQNLKEGQKRSVTEKWFLPECKFKKAGFLNRFLSCDFAILQSCDFQLTQLWGRSRF
jgi:hypothetical protein